jgi:Fe-S-cluster containining protein
VDIEQFRKQADNLKKDNARFYNKLKLKSPKHLDELFHSAHDETFETTDCLACANCCKTTSPIFYQKDIERASKRLRIKPGAFIEKYLRVDEDNDYVLQSSPCVFLGADNYCGIYEDRPNACREYPHTDRKKISQVLELTYKNTLVCPAVLKITEKVKKQLGL